MQVHQRGDLPDAGVLHLGRPDAVRQPGFRQGPRDGRVGADPRVDDGDAIQDVGRVGAGVPHGLRLAQHVVLVNHLPVAPALGAEEVKVYEAPKREELHEDPDGHFGRAAAVLPDEVAAEQVVAHHVDLALAAPALVVVEARHIVAREGVAVLAIALGRDPHQLRARRVLHVERQRQQRVAQIAVERGERPQVAEVEVDVLAVARPADALLEEGAVRGDLEEVGSLGEVLGVLLLGAQLERDALRLEVLDLLLDREQGLA